MVRPMLLNSPTPLATVVPLTFHPEPSRTVMVPSSLSCSEVSDSPLAPTTSSKTPSPFTSTGATEDPKRSPASGVPGMPASAWLMTPVDWLGLCGPP